MSQFVVDASVAVKWLLPEVDDHHALRLINDRHDLAAPELLHAEVGNALWKRVIRQSMPADDAMFALEGLQLLPIDLHTLTSLTAPALDIACLERRSLYDCLYLALAVRLQVPLVTADRKFHDAIKRGALADRIVWIADAT